MTNSDYFRFENEKNDFPFYNDKPYLSTTNWLIFLAGIILFILSLHFVPKFLPTDTHGFIYFLAIFVPFLIATRGKVGTIFKKPKLNDIKTIIICFILGYLLSMILAVSLHALGITTVDNPIIAENHNLMFFITLFVQLMGEELLKIMSLLILMFVIYKYTENRKLALCIAYLFTLIIFGLLHTTTYGGNVLHALIIIGFGSFFDVFAYVKSKNILVSYSVHVLTDLVGLFLGTMGASMLSLLL